MRCIDSRTVAREGQMKISNVWNALFWKHFSQVRWEQCGCNLGEARETVPNVIYFMFLVTWQKSKKAPLTSSGQRCVLTTSDSTDPSLWLKRPLSSIRWSLACYNWQFILVSFTSFSHSSNSHCLLLYFPL